MNNETEPTLLSASEARKLIDEGRTKTDQESYTNAVHAINEAIRSKKDYAQVSSLTKNARVRIEAMGYRIETGRQYNETYYNIVIP